MAEFHFIRPYALFLLLILLAAWLLLRFRSYRQGAWTHYIDPALQPYVLSERANETRSNHAWPWYLLAILLIVALAGPSWEKLPAPVFATQQPLVIALDLSQSMNAQDVLPSRVQQAKIRIQDILNARPDGLTALLVFAGDAFVVTPMTDDVRTIVSLLPSLSAGIMPVQGSRIAPALALADQLLTQSGSLNGQVVLITDGVSDLASAKNAAASLVDRGHRVSVMAIGTEQGDVVRDDRGKFIKNRSGNIVVAKVPLEDLQSIAAKGQGVYTRLQNNGADVSALLADRAPAFSQAVNINDLTTDLWREQGPWLVLLCLPFLALVFRKGLIMMLAVVAIFPWQSVSAGFWDDLWSRPDQQGEKKFIAEEYAKAAELYADPERKAAAFFRDGDYQNSIATLEGIDTPDAHYNRGNALAYSGEIERAIEAYQQALALDDQHEDAKFNLDLLLEKQQEQQQEQQESESEEQEQGQNEQQQNAENQSQESESSEGQSDQEQSGEESEDNSQEQQSDSQGEEGQEQQQEQMAEIEEDMTEEEKEQAVEQWLRRIPDDPGGLLRRKFVRQYKTRGRNKPEPEENW